MLKPIPVVVRWFARSVRRTAPYAVCAATAGLGVIPQVHAADSFFIEAIHFEGLRRISQGTVFSYLPVKVGDLLDERRSSETILALYKTGFFKDVRLLRRGRILVVKLVEQPVISGLAFEGNRDIDTEKLTKALKDIGVEQGKVFNRQLLDRIEQDLKRQYYNRGKYGVEIRSKVVELDENRVAVTLNISEGVTAAIARIDVVGNKNFSDKELLKSFELKPRNLVAAVTGSDQYTKQKLSADLERLRSFYLDRGYLKFEIESTQVEISPDKRDIFITVNIKEGDVYTISEIKLAGKLATEPKQLIPLVTLNPGEVFSRKHISETSDAISKRLGEDGHIFANVNMVPDINDERRTVKVTFVIDPGRRVTVRRISFKGNTKTRDEVLRRELRQVESAPAATAKIERSKVRLERLGYFQDVNLETPAVPGSTDQIDLNYSITERASGSLSAGVGFSQTQGIIFNVNLSQDNLLGSGKRVNLAFNNSNITTLYRLGYLNPYFTLDGVAAGFDISYRATNASAANLSSYSTDQFNVGGNLGIPLNEKDRLRFNLDYQLTKLRTFGDRGVCPQPIGSAPADSVPPVDVTRTPCEIFAFTDTNGRDFSNFLFSLGWTRDTLNRAIFPSAGTRHSLSFAVTVPGSDLEYFKADYRAQTFIGLTSRTTLSLGAEAAYGDGYGSTGDLPFFENFFAGGFNSVRGYLDNTLGPRDSNNLAFGGSSKLVFNSELQLPLPVGDLKSVRFGPFFDGGNVFTPDKPLAIGDLRYSTGLFARWLSPFGAIGFSIAQPLNSRGGDRQQVFQFSFGAGFF